jgi:Na+/H+ antiporter NhaD/arsenite permease-like protein
MSASLRGFLRREPVLVIAAAAALLSCLLVPPDRGYAAYFDLRTLALLYCLMTVVAGLRTAGLFPRLAHDLCGKLADVRALGLLLTLLCFFSAMLVTNDVALLTFVPLSAAMLTSEAHGRDLIRIVTLQTVAANLGSMLTPIGNPQNLYLYSFFDLGMGDFARIVFPLWLLSLVLACALCLRVSRSRLTPELGEAPRIDARRAALYLGLFALCLLTVFRVLPWPALLAAVIAILLVLDRKTLLQADFCLLLTFMAFFVFSGNLARVDAVDRLLRRLLEGRVYLISLLTSQVISNVPAALLLSGFTDNVRELLRGVNVGGLGTPIASLASLISLKLYSHSDHAHTGRFLLEFTAVNAVLLVLLSAAALLV